MRLSLLNINIIRGIKMSLQDIKFGIFSVVIDPDATEPFTNALWRDETDGTSDTYGWIVAKDDGNGGLKSYFSPFDDSMMDKDDLIEIAELVHMVNVELLPE
jgi:hypothetical protein